MHQTKAISWNQAKSGDDAAEKCVSNDDKKLLAEATQLLGNVLEKSSKSSSPDVSSTQNQISDAKEGREVQELFQELSKEREEGQRRIEEFAAKIQQDRTQDLWRGQECRGCQKWFGETP